MESMCEGPSRPLLGGEDPRAGDEAPRKGESWAPDAWHTLGPFVFPALGGVLFGYDIGATSGAILSLQDPALSGIAWPPFSALRTGLVVSGSLIGALLGSALAFVIADPLGRRRELLLASLWYTLGACTASLAASFPALLAGRVLYGVGIGLAMHAAPMYIAETAPASLRGTLVSLLEVCTVSGILLGYLAGVLFIAAPGGWREIFGLGAPVALLMAAGMWALPPSPRWLILSHVESASAGDLAGQDRPAAPASVSWQESAVQALLRLRGPRLSRAEAEAQVDSILSSQEAAAEGSRVAQGKGFSELLEGVNGVALRVALGLMLFQQITGQPSVLYYAAPILQQAGFTSASDATSVSVAIGLCKLLMTGIAVFLVDRAGRRPLLITGVAGLILSLVVLGLTSQVQGASPVWSAGALLLFVGAYQVSFGPISWLIVSEIFSLRMRGRAQSMATLVNFAANALVTFALPPLQERIGQAGTFFMFATIAVVALAFIWTSVPETKGLSLEEVQERLQGGAGDPELEAPA